MLAGSPFLFLLTSSISDSSYRNGEIPSLGRISSVFDFPRKSNGGDLPILRHSQMVEGRCWEDPPRVFGPLMNGRGRRSAPRGARMASSSETFAAEGHEELGKLF